MKIQYLLRIGILFVIINFSACNTSKNLSQSDINKIDIKIITADIDNFWTAYDSLENTTDSAYTIQHLYIDKASDELKKVLEVRPDFTANNFISAINQYPKFWKSVRNCTKDISKKKEIIESALIKIKQIYPEFNIPTICFCITPTAFGGTASKDHKVLFIGAEIVLADSNVIVTDFNNLLKDIIGTLDVVPYIVHESVHTAQIPKCKPSVFSETMTEGSADFITSYILKDNFNKKIYEYGYQNECEIWKDIKPDLENDNNYSKWFGSYDKNKHPDLGYFIGYRIVQSYYEKATNKDQALIDIIQMKKPKHIFKKSEYNGNCLNED